MKTITLILIYIGTFMFFFFLLSLVGLLWINTYWECISSVEWFVIYTIFIGWWISIPVTQEYWKANEDYFEEVFG
jgi:hypothetical protein